MKISFDFDDTLSLDKIQELAKSLIESGNDVWVITSRFGKSLSMHRDLYYVCDSIGLPRHKVLFTDGGLKCNEYARGSFDMHYDDDWEEVSTINTDGGLAILVKPDFSEIYTEMQYRDNGKV
jgi:hypothetical protein